MFFERFKKKKTKDVSQDIIERENGYEKLHEPVISGRQKVIESCEQIIDVTREFEDARKEYALVTEYLKDIEFLNKQFGHQARRTGFQQGLYRYF